MNDGYNRMVTEEEIVVTQRQVTAGMTVIEGTGQSLGYYGREVLVKTYLAMRCHESSAGRRGTCQKCEIALKAKRQDHKYVVCAAGGCWYRLF